MKMNKLIDEHCEKCKGELTSRTTNRLNGLYCENCHQWAVVTTYIPEIQLDEQIYKLYLMDNHTVDLSTIKYIAQISNSNFLEAKRLLNTPHPMIYEGKAFQTAEIIKKLSNAQLKFICIPEFPM